MRKLCRFTAALALLLIVTGCGGGGGGGGTEEGTTPLDQNNMSSLHGTYNFEYFMFTDGTTSFESSELDFFRGRFTMDLERNWITTLIEMKDEGLGLDVYDYSEEALGYDGDFSFDNFYVEQTGDYTLTMYYDNLCVDGLCLDALMRIRKTSDDIKNLLAKPAFRVIETEETFMQRLARQIIIGPMYKPKPTE